MLHVNATMFRQKLRSGANDSWARPAVRLALKSESQRSTRWTAGTCVERQRRLAAIRRGVSRVRNMAGRATSPLGALPHQRLAMADRHVAEKLQFCQQSAFDGAKNKTTAPYV